MRSGLRALLQKTAHLGEDFHGLEIDLRLVSFRVSYGDRYGVRDPFQCRAHFLVADLSDLRFPDCAKAARPAFSSRLARWHRKQRLGNGRTYSVFLAVHR